MNVYLYPAPNNNSRFFDKYYSALLQKKDTKIKVKILEPAGKFGKKIFSFVMNRLGCYFPKLPSMAINYLLRNDRGGVVHFTTQLAVQPYIRNRFIFTYHDILHMQPGLTGRFYTRSVLNRIDLAYRKAVCIVTVSEFSKKQLQLYYPGDKELFVVFPPATSDATVAKPENNHVLFVGSDHPRKNLAFFLESIAQLKDLDLKVSIVCRLSGGNYYYAFDYLVKKLELKNVRLYESISTSELDGLYASASIFCFPTFMEGFGMPPVEAQMHGVPVIASDIPICHEVLGDSCLYFNPLSTNDMADKIRMLINDVCANIKSELIRKGSENVRKYSINASVDAQFEVYRRLLK